MSQSPAPRLVGGESSNLLLDLFVVDQRIGALLSAALAPTGVRPAEYAVYGELGRGPASPGELCERLGVTRSTMTGYLAALQRRGDTTRETDPADRRSYRVALTDSGHARLAECRPRFRAALERVEARLGAALAESRRALALVDHALEEAVSQQEGTRRRRPAS